MGATYQGGPGGDSGISGRDGGDLIRWKLEIDDGMEPMDAFGSGGRALYGRARPTTVELTLYDVSKEESIAVVQLLNEMRSASTGIVLTEPPTIGNRFSGLDL